MGGPSKNSMFDAPGFLPGEGDSFSPAKINQKFWASGLSYELKDSRMRETDAALAKEAKNGDAAAIAGQK